MGSHKSRVCVLSVEEAHRVQFEGAKLDCNTHEHASYHKASQLTASLLYTSTIQATGKTKYVYEFSWVNGVGRKRAIVPSEARSWVIRKSGGMTVHQLVSK